MKTSEIENNNCGYSKEWQPYIGDYDKNEYDIKLKDGTIIHNCYPNARKFNNYFGDISVHEDEVAEIKFSETDRLRINDSRLYE